MRREWWLSLSALLLGDGLLQPVTFHHGPLGIGAAGENRLEVDDRRAIDGLDRSDP